MQLATQCILVEDVYGTRPPYGVLVLAGGAQVRVPFTPALEQRVLKVAGEMRDLLRRAVEPGAEWVAPKCRACGFRRRCWE
jgi:CRISPR/Cas system-associated exonuclease Cas4 (RecB family)